MNNKEEALKFLKTFITEVNTQDNRITATPYFYELRCREDGGDRPLGYRGNFFFTEKAAKEYIRSEAHNLPEGTYDYLQHAYRNTEIKQLLEAIGLVTGVPYERK